MSRVTLKSMLLLVLVLFVIFFLYICEEKLEATTNISEIENTEELYSYQDSEVVTIRKHYMIINPPEDVYELKTVIEKYYKNNHINRETMVKKNKKGHIEVYFYRKSSDKNDYGAVIEEVEYINDEIVE